MTRELISDEHLQRMQIVGAESQAAQANLREAQNRVSVAVYATMKLREELADAYKLDDGDGITEQGVITRGDPKPLAQADKDAAALRAVKQGIPRAQRRQMMRLEAKQSAAALSAVTDGTDANSVA